MADPRTTFYPEWIAANGWAEALGLGTTLLLGRAAAPALERDPGPGGIVLGALAAVVVGIVLEGLVVGIAQARVLRDSLRAVSAARWTRGTMLGAGMAWFLGMVPSTVVALVGTVPAGGAEPVAEPPAMVRYGLALALGALAGPVLGLGQWLVLRPHVARAGRWIMANALAWAPGMVVIFIGMDQVPWARGGVTVVLGVYLVCGAAGLLVGAVHGWILRDLLRAESSAHAGGSGSGA